MVKDREKLKQLSTLLRKLEGTLEYLKKEKSQLDKDLTLKTEEIKKLKKEIASLKEKEIIVSEHAILRYIERIIGINIDTIKEKILTENIRIQIQEFGNGSYSNGEFKVVVKDNVIVTVIEQ
jgi:predicted nuclease with TOPRIM domain